MAIGVEAMKEVASVLAEAGQPLHYREIARRVVDRGSWSTRSQAPEGVLNALLTQDIQKNGASSTFERKGKGVVALREWSETPMSVSPSPTPPPGKGTNGDTPLLRMSFADAAAHVLEHYAGQQPMHYRDLANKALELRLVQSAGKAPENNLYAQIWSEIDRMSKRGETPRFVKIGPGLFALTSWSRSGLGNDIEQHNSAVRRRLHQHLLAMPPDRFEALIGRLLGTIGFQEVVTTAYSQDGGIDVRGTLVVGDVIRTRMAVQVKRWKGNVQRQEVQQVRGSLGTHEQGLIITTSGFSSGAREEAQRSDAVPVALMDGDQLVALLIEHSLGIRRESHDIIELADIEDS